MSMNLILTDGRSRYEALCQTPTEITDEALKSGNPFEVYERWYRDTFMMPPLMGKDRRNPYLIQQHAEERQRIEMHLAGIRQYLRVHPNAKWGVI